MLTDAAATTAALMVGVGVASWAGALVVLRYARRLGLVRDPNQRSSHAIATPHGGGLGFVLSALAAGLWLERRSGAQLWPILFSSIAIGAVSLLDDLRPLPAAFRFAVHSLVCGAMWYALYASEGTATPAASVWLLSTVIVLSGIWWINLFNFMDGIDGIAAMEGIFVLGCGAMLAAWRNPGVMTTQPWIWTLAIVAAVCGFIVHNWPPARIFMGDVGSTWLAFTIFGLALVAERDGWLTYPAWLILGALFVADATVTLLRRVLGGERWFEAHKSHAYQRLARRWGSHRKVTLSALAINLCWLAPIAWASQAWPAWAWLAVCAAYAPLAWAAMSLGAGRSDGA